MYPVRCTSMMLAVVENETVPFPTPLKDPLKTIQLSVDEAVHAQPAGPVTEIVPELPTAEKKIGESVPDAQGVS